MPEKMLSLAISQKSSRLDGITLNEPTDHSIMEKLLNSSLSNEKGKNIDHFENEKKKLTTYKGLLVNGYYKVQYSKRKGNPYGRCNPYVGLHTIHRPLRHSLVGHKMEDIDIENAHPTMLLQLLEANSVSCPLLGEYVNDRQYWFNLVNKHWKVEEVLSCVSNEDTKRVLRKEIPKGLFIQICFGGGVKSWIKKWDKIKVKVKNNKNVLTDIVFDGIDQSIKPPQLIYDFIAEIRGHQRLIAEKNPHLVEVVRQLKTEKEAKEKNLANKTVFRDENGEFVNLHGSVCSHFLQEYEVRILEVMFLYCCENNYIKNEVCVLCADGMMILKEDYKPSLLTELTEVIQKKLGFRLRFTNKKMDEGYDEETINANMVFTLWKEGFNSGPVCEYIKMMFPNKFLYIRDTLYSYNGVYWKQIEDKNYSCLHNFLDNQFKTHLLNQCSKEENKLNTEMSLYGEEEMTEQQKAQKKAVEADMDKLIKFKSLVLHKLSTYNFRVEFVKDAVIKMTDNSIVMDDNPFLFAFNNKIYDLKQGVFVEPHYTQYISFTAGWNWSDYYNPNLVKELEDILKSIHPNKEVREYYLMILATGMYGQLIEHLFIAQGCGGNGKSLINDLYQSALGKYSYKMPSSVLLNPLKDGGNPEVACASRKRGVIADEPDASKRISSATIKALTGASRLNARKNYSNDVEVLLLLTLILECNTLPKMDEITQAVVRRIRVIPFNGVFIDKEKYDAMTPEEREEKGISGPTNKWYKTQEFKEKYRQALVVLMMKQFERYKENGFNFPKEPKEVMYATKDYMMASDDIAGWFLNTYKQDGKPEGERNVISADDIYKRFTTSQFWYLAPAKYRRDMNQKSFYALLENSVNLKPYLIMRDKRFQGTKYKKMAVWGFAEKTAEDDEAEKEEEAEEEAEKEESEDDEDEETTEEEEEEEEVVTLTSTPNPNPNPMTPPPMPMIRRVVK